ncbi:CBS domain-containing protein [Thermodesulfobacterium sp. TA1]|uniref:putative nucleotidyltransferase substrate binding domain-containing protein n=1 Tax=Thermodesulfobacterium sp. TA1 TaxID=2234087 RepID=UPI001232B004|nr:putative nucleotidyltransferase substrate binding domain-containing protein [Thermodesulfobacterium sp. TA1]QER42598.1 CBS domain-containing protein [Thermodesulfobacterium sp. TA1]
MFKNSLFDQPLKNLPLKTPLIVHEEDRLDKVVKLMVEKDYSFVVVQGKEGLGIITEKDFLQKVVYPQKNPSEIKAKEIATFPLISLTTENLLFEALLLMAENRVRKVAVFEKGILQGILEDTDIISFQSKNLVSLLYQVELSHDLEELARLYTLVKEGVLNQIAEGFNPEYLGKYLAEINDLFIKKTIEITLKDLEGKPPSNFGVFVLGSEGRKEQSLKTDQDNTLIYKDLSEEKKEEVDRFFERFSSTFIDNLLKVGFPPCPGGVMVSNPLWRGDLKTWKNRLSNWLDCSQKEALLNLCIFLDFRMVYGDEEIEKELKEWITEKINQNKRLIICLAAEAIRFEPPLNFLGRFITEKEGPNKGKLDLKKAGIFPIVQGVRTLALEYNIWQTNTFDRIEALKKEGVLSLDFASELKEGYRFILSLQFLNQAQKIKKGQPPDNYLNPQELSKNERNQLKQVFKTIKTFQEFLFRKYNLRFFT